MLVEIVDEGSLSGLGKVPDLQSLLSSTQQYGSVLRQLLTSAGVQLPVLMPSVVSPEQLVRVARQAAAQDVAQILKRHEKAAHKRFSEEAQKLAKKGVPRQEIERRVRSAIEKLPATQARRAAAELQKAGSVTKQTQSALNVAKKLYPGLQEQIKKATEPVRKLQSTVLDVQKKVQDAKKIAQKLPPPLRDAVNALNVGKLDTAALKKAGAKEGKKLLQQYGAKHGVDALKKLAPDVKLPAGIDASAAADLILSGKKITAERALQAGYVTTKGVAERLIATKAGIPIKLPAKLTAKEISKSLTSIIPTNLSEAIDTGIAIGAQYASSAVAALVAGSAIGSVIPGIGTVVGIGVALAINAFKDDFKKLFAEEPQPYEKKCATKVTCAEPPKLSPIELLPWVAKEQARVSQIVAQDQKKSYCGRGSGPQCESRLYWLERQIMDIVYPSSEYKTADQMFADSTVGVIGLPLVKRLIPIYEKAPKSYPYFDAGGMEYVVVRKPVAPPKTLTFQEKEQIRLGLHRIGGASGSGAVAGPVARRTFRKGTQRIEQRANNVPVVLALLYRRRKMLDSLVDRNKRIGSLTGELITYRLDLATELKNAMVQYSLDPSKYTKEWLEQVARMWEALLKREAASQSETKSRYEQDLRREAELRKQGKTGVVTGIV